MPAHLSSADFPANDLEKSGYIVEFHDEFDGSTLDANKWLPYYLPQWGSREQSAPLYIPGDSALVLQIAEGQPPWCPEFDGRDFYFDNAKTRTIHQSPDYPMLFMLSIYELPFDGAWTGAYNPADPYPKSFTIDCFRAYQPVGGYT